MMTEPRRETPESALVRTARGVRGLDRGLWIALRLEAIRRQQSAGSLLNEILAEWLGRQGAGDE